MLGISRLPEQLLASEEDSTHGVCLCSDSQIIMTLGSLDVNENETEGATDFLGGSKAENMLIN
jgi:hypothetical protein